MPSLLCIQLVPTGPPNKDLSTSSLGFFDVTQNLVKSDLVAGNGLTIMCLGSAQEKTYMTGPMKLSNFVGLPTLILATCSRSLSLKPPAFHTEEETYNLERAEHFWPKRS